MPALTLASTEEAAKVCWDVSSSLGLVSAGRWRPSGICGSPRCRCLCPGSAWRPGVATHVLGAVIPDVVGGSPADAITEHVTDRRARGPLYLAMVWNDSTSYSWVTIWSVSKGLATFHTFC